MCFRYELQEQTLEFIQEAGKIKYKIFSIKSQESRVDTKQFNDEIQIRSRQQRRGELLMMACFVRIFFLREEEHSSKIE